MQEPTHDELRAFIGPRASIYLKRWEPHWEQTWPAWSWSWPAALAGVFWFGYRKMYAYLAAFVAIVFVETLLEELYFIEYLGRDEVPPALTRTMMFVYPILCGALGNRLYYKRASSAIARNRGRGLSGEALTTALERQGGTSVLSGILGVVLGVILFVAAFLVVDLLLYG